MTATPAAVEFLYELWDANWDDGPLGNWQIIRHPITKKTARRIYFTYSTGGHRAGFIDRQKIEADGEICHGYTLRRLHLTEPEIPSGPKPPDLAALKAEMAAAHPDVGGTDEAFITARRRYEAVTRPCRITGCTRNAAPGRRICWTHKNRLYRYVDPHLQLRTITHPDTIPPVVEDRLPDHGLTRTAAQLLATQGVHPSEIAHLLGVTERTVYRWQAERFRQAA